MLARLTCDEAEARSKLPDFVVQVFIVSLTSFSEKLSYQETFSVNLGLGDGRTNTAKLALWVALSVVAAGTSWLYWAHVLESWEHYNRVETGSVKAEMDDLYPRWVGTRALLLERRDPYAPEVSHQIQMAFYGRPIVQSYDQPPDKIIDEQRFAYPIYVVFLLAPAAHLPFATVEAWAVPCLMVFTVLTVIFWARVLKWQGSWASLAAIVFFVLGTPQLLQGLRVRQLGLLVSCLLALAAWCLVQNYLTAAGVLLAVSTIKPQMVALPIAWFLIWAAGDLRQRWRFLAAFGGTLGALVGAGELLEPGWISEFIAGLAAYRKYVQFPPLSEVFLGTTLGTIASGAIVFGLLVFAWKNRQAGSDSMEFTSTLSAFLIGAALALPLLRPFNQVLLLLPAWMILRDWKRLPQPSRVVFTLIIAWPWITELALLIFPPHLRSSSRLALAPSALVPLIPLLLPVLLMTRRTLISAATEHLQLAH